MNQMIGSHQVHQNSPGPAGGIRSKSQNLQSKCLQYTSIHFKKITVNSLTKTLKTKIVSSTTFCARFEG